MGKASYDMLEVRFLIKKDCTECYIFCKAYGDCPEGVQGWHFKRFHSTVPVIEIVGEYAKDCVMWPLKAPGEMEG